MAKRLSKEEAIQKVVDKINLMKDPESVDIGKHMDRYAVLRDLEGDEKEEAYKEISAALFGSWMTSTQPEALEAQEETEESPAPTPAPKAEEEAEQAEQAAEVLAPAIIHEEAKAEEEAPAQLAVVGTVATAADEAPATGAADLIRGAFWGAAFWALDAVYMVLGAWDVFMVKLPGRIEAGRAFLLALLAVVLPFIGGCLGSTVAAVKRSAPYIRGAGMAAAGAALAVILTGCGAAVMAWRGIRAAWSWRADLLAECA